MSYVGYGRKNVSSGKASLPPLPPSPCSPAELSVLQAEWHKRCEEWEVRRGVYTQQKDEIRSKSQVLEDAYLRFEELKEKHSEYQHKREALGCGIRFGISM